MRVAIVPARGGSKRVPLKNIKPFLGTPMLKRTLDVLQNSGLFDQIIVSTDSVVIQELAIQCNVDCSNLRPKELSSDDISTVDVIAYEIDYYGLSKDDFVCCVYAPNPFLREDSLELGHKIIEENEDLNYVTTVTSFPFPVQRSLRLESNGKLVMANPENIWTHSQNLEERYHECAQFWWGRAGTWTKKIAMQDGLVGINIPRWMTQDIDTEEDWIQAEIRWKILRESDSYNEYRVTKDNLIS
jgi:N-acylneuraminate cytidylyltransferase